MWKVLEIKTGYKQPPSDGVTLKIAELFGDQRCEGWAVAWSGLRKDEFIPLGFDLERQAEAACNAVAKLAAWGPTVDDVRKQFLSLGPQMIRKVMLEAVADNSCERREARNESSQLATRNSTLGAKRP